MLLFKYCLQQILDAAPGIDKLENNFIESNKKVKTLCETVSNLEFKLKEVSSQLVLSNKKCDQLTKDNKKLRCIEDDLSKQVISYYNV